MNDVEPRDEKKTMMTLVGEYQWLTQELIASGGEITPALEQWHANIVDQVAEKGEALKFIIDCFVRDADFWKGYAEKYTRMYRSCNTTVERIKNTMKHSMMAMGMKEIQSGVTNIKLTDSQPALEIHTPDAIPDMYKKTVQTVEIDRELVKKHLLDGIPVPGATLNEVKSLRFYVKK